LKEKDEILYNITNSVFQNNVATTLRKEQKQQAERVAKMNKKSEKGKMDP
jgi:hypothetical protein